MWDSPLLIGCKVYSNEFCTEKRKAQVSYNRIDDLKYCKRRHFCAVYIFAHFARALDARKFDVSENYYHNRKNRMNWYVKILANVPSRASYRCVNCAVQTVCILKTLMVGSFRIIYSNYVSLKAVRNNIVHVVTKHQK